MNIRKYTLISMIVIILISITTIVSYQKYFSYKLNKDFEESSAYSRLVKTEDKEIKIYKDKSWQTIDLKGVELSSFKPGYGRFKTGISKSEVKEWLDLIGEMNVNVIKIPYIQPTSFYSAIYDYNLEREDPIYIIHEIMLDEKAVLTNYNAFDKTIIKNLKRDIRKTINVIHGEAVIVSNKRSHRGVYLKDISDYNLGFIIGTNTNPELVTLTNSANKKITSYDGEYFEIEKGNAFEVFIAEMLDYISKYEVRKYKRLSLVSFLTSPEIDVFKYKHESNVTKNANINIENIRAKGNQNLFVSYKFHPNSAEFLDYEYIEVSKDNKEIKPNKSVFKTHLARLNDVYKLPLVISDTGISSSRGISKMDESDGFNRGGFSEKEQGEKIVTLLDNIYSSGANGVILSSWQDNWTNLTSFSLVEDYLDESASSYWHDVQSSDESFGFLKFETGKKDEKIYVDGDLSDWENVDYILDEDKMKLKVKSDASNLYILVEKEDWSLNDDFLYLGIDITPLSGSKIWEDEAKFSTEADFVIKLKGYRESRIVVNERYNIFDYLYKYYAHIIEKQDKIPEKNNNKFSSIYLLNRRKFYLKDSNNTLSPIYHETGKLVHGTDNPDDEDFNSLVDFNKTDDAAEIKIPWILLNIKNPLDKKAYNDFYLEGVSSQLSVKDIGFSINYRSSEEELLSNQARYNMEKFKGVNYFERIKDSYYIVKDYWKNNP